MNLIVQALQQVLGDLSELDTPAALVGGLAVSVRAEPRFTRDVDLAVVAADDHEAEQVIHALASKGYAIQQVLEHLPSGRMATVRLVPPGIGGAVLVDLLFASSGIEDEIVVQATRLELVPGLMAPVARAGHLIAMKALSFDETVRPQDHDDLIALISASDEGEIDRARDAVTLISRRGFDRQRDLREVLEVALAQASRPWGGGRG